VFLPTAWGQDILIVRPLDNNQTEVKKRKIVFAVEVSSFDPVLRVTINGEPQKLDPAPTVLIKKRVRLKPGLNKFLVEVTTEFDTASKEFEIRYRTKKKAPAEVKKDPFQLIGVLGGQTSSNALKVPAGATETSARRDFLILIPRYDWVLTKASTLRFQAIFSRDLQEKLELESEEIAFTQFTGSWIINTSKTNSWTFGLGYNLIYQKVDSLLNGENRKEYDVFLFGSVRRGLGPKSFYDVSLELKTQELVEEPVDPDSNEDAQATTLLAALEGPLGGFKGKLKGGYATTDADGKLKDKDVLRLSADLSVPLGTFILGFGVKARQNKFKEPNPFFNDVTPEETLTTYFLNGTLPLSRSWIVTAEYLTESQSSNVPSSEYENDGVATSIIFIF
jgi:hypothetical protein